MAVKQLTTGTDEISRLLENCGNQAQAIAAKGLYVGAGYVADEIQIAIDELPTETFRFADESNPRRLSLAEKQALQRRHTKGIAKFEKSGAELSTAVGLRNSGYCNLGNTKVPVPLLARSIESGTSFRVKQPFFRKAVNKCRGRVERKMIDEMDKRLRELLEAK